MSKNSSPPVNKRGQSPFYRGKTKRGLSPFIVGSVPRTDHLGNVPYISQKIEPSPLFIQLEQNPIYIRTHIHDRLKEFRDITWQNSDVLAEGLSNRDWKIGFILRSCVMCGPKR